MFEDNGSCTPCVLNHIKPKSPKHENSRYIVIDDTKLSAAEHSRADVENTLRKHRSLAMCLGLLGLALGVT